VGLPQQSGQLKNRDFALFAADGEVLASTVGGRQRAHADTTKNVRRYQLTDRLTLVTAVVHPHVLKRTLLRPKRRHLTHTYEAHM